MRLSSWFCCSWMIQLFTLFVACECFIFAGIILTCNETRGMSAARKTTMMMCDERQDIMRRERCTCFIYSMKRARCHSPSVSPCWFRLMLAWVNFQNIFYVYQRRSNLRVQWRRNSQLEKKKCDFRRNEMWALVKRWEKRFSHQKTFFFELLCRLQQHWHWQQKLLPTRRTFKSSHVRMETSFLAFEIETVLTYQTSMQRDSWVIWVCRRRERRGKSANFQIASAFVPIDFLKLFKKQTMSVPRQVVSELPNRRQSCSTTAQLIKN